jgi:ABC-2 type transport system ATP-binding protein
MPYYLQRTNGVHSPRRKKTHMYPSLNPSAPTGSNAAVRSCGLVKTYGDVVALNGLDLTVSEGTVLGLLGPNGAGKPTAVSILTTLVQPDSGTATVAGADVVTAPGEVRKRMPLGPGQERTGFGGLSCFSVRRSYGWSSR